jgi:hypothetical protein
MPKLFLDCDGVLADFDAGAKALLGMMPRAFEAKRGKGEFWKRLARADNFYGSLPLMADARELFDAVRHLQPTVLTGLPLGKWAAPQKLEWVEAHFPGTPVITCMARDKVKYMTSGDVLVDDQERHRHLWDDAGGVFIHHRSAKQSLAELKAVYPSIKA